MTPYRSRSQRGFGYIAAIVLLVVLAGLAAGLMRMNTTQLTTSALDLDSARAYQAAGAGIQKALYQALTTDTCFNDTLDLSASNGFRVTVSCNRTMFNEGESAPGTPFSKAIYSISAVACNIGNPCPSNDNATAKDYVERRRIATACVATTMTGLTIC
jgi:MSHA biogenesis protein MshP